MIAGLPGTGLGGLFYLAAALVMIARGSISVLRGRSERTHWKKIVPMGVITMGILGALVATYWFLDGMLALSENLETSANIVPAQASGAGHLHSIFIATLPIQVASLAALLLAVEVLHLLLKGREKKKKPEPIVAQRDSSPSPTPARVFVEQRVMSWEETKVLRQ